MNNFGHERLDVSFGGSLPATESEMLAVFLQGEINSPRFGAAIRFALARDGQDPSVVENPNASSKEEDRYRYALMAECRGYPDSSLFERFPHDVEWRWVSLDKGELTSIKYMNYEYFRRLTNGSRLVVDGAATIIKGEEIYGTHDAYFRTAAQALRNGATFPPPILGRLGHGELVVIEGHTRLTAYAMVPAGCPQKIRTLVGYSQDLRAWDAIERF